MQGICFNYYMNLIEKIIKEYNDKRIFWLSIGLMLVIVIAAYLVR